MESVLEKSGNKILSLKKTSKFLSYNESFVLSTSTVFIKKGEVCCYDVFVSLVSEIVLMALNNFYKVKIRNNGTTYN